MLLDMLKCLHSKAYSGHTPRVYLPILLGLPTNTLGLPTNTPRFTLHNPRKYNTKELLGLILISKMSDLIVKDNALMNASYNLDLVEQRLILWLS